MASILPPYTPKLPTEAYHGYLIKTSPFRDDYWIECNDIVIAQSVASSQQAKRLIDNLIKKETP